ncbi:hypothetical protein RND81_01G025000 [Saponaria officinalis]|uniref:Non-specific lipid-transfer protein n=1 Tax=Saponaria officinalis TaxID=3572 RepID=A0AAW1NC64_SAPOF
MGSSIVMKSISLIFAFMVMVALPCVEAAIDCNMTCSSVVALANMATTPSDKEVVCQCVQSMLDQVYALSIVNAVALPNQCGADLPYTMSATADCTAVFVINIIFSWKNFLNTDLK